MGIHRALAGKSLTITQLIAEGSSKLASVPSGGSGGGAGSPPAGGAPAPKRGGKPTGSPKRPGGPRQNAQGSRGHR